MDISIHDNQLLSYSVLSLKREIHLHTLYSEKNEYTDVIFSGVIAYHFECDNFRTIIFDIEEGDLEEIYNDNEPLFLRLKNYGWINIDYNSKEELLRKMLDNNIKAYNLHSSYGLSGWVWAENMLKQISE